MFKNEPNFCAFIKFQIALVGEYECKMCATSISQIKSNLPPKKRKEIMSKIKTFLFSHNN